MSVITGTSGADTITPAGVSTGVTGGVPGTGADSILGGDGNDVLDGGTGANTILGGAGNDTIYASGYGESLDGGTGTNTYAYAGADWAVIDIGLGFATKQGVTDTLVGFQAAYGGSGNDTIKGGDNSNDTLGGGPGADYIDGRGGFDVVDYGTTYAGTITTGVAVNLSTAAVTVAGKTMAAGTGLDSWGSTDTLLNIEGAFGTAYADTLVGRLGAASSLVGGAGNDYLAGGNLGNSSVGGGANTINGGAGDDTILANGYNESLYGGGGNDAVAYTGAQSLTIDLGTDNSGPNGYQGFLSYYSNATTLFGFDRAYAGTGNDTIKGTNGDDTLSGDAGNNTIDGRAGFNTLDYSTTYASASIPAGAFVNLSTLDQTIGTVTVKAGTALNPWGGTDTLANIQGVLGTAAADTMVGSNLDNLLSGGDGNDSLNGSGGNDTLLGGNGDDTLRGGDGNDSIDAGTGNDSIIGGLGSDTIEGGALTERNSLDYRFSTTNYAGGPLHVVFSDGATATVTKVDGVDSIHDINQIYGTGNADYFDLSLVSSTAPLPFVIRGGAGSDTVIGNGTDRVIADFNDSTAAINVNLATGVAQDGQGGVDSLVNVRAIVASYGGNDTLVGSTGDDTFIVSGPGSKSITGGGGNDTYRYQGSAGVYIDLGTSSVSGAYVGNAYHSGSTDTLVGFDRVEGGLGADTIKGTNGNDTLAGDVGADNIDGRGGLDVVDYSYFSTSPITTGVIVNLTTASQTFGTTTLAADTAKDPWGYTDTLANIEGAIGTDFSDTLLGTAGNDSFNGGAGDDSISSGSGLDTLIGGAGNDSLKGGDGNDSLDGGSGFDVAVYTVASSAATWARDPGTGHWTVTIASTASNEGTDVMTGVEALSFSDRRLDFAEQIRDDITATGHSDILWRNTTDGSFALWSMNGLTGTGYSYGKVTTDWHLVGTGDFNGDGFTDVLWRNDNGQVSQWQTGPGGSFVSGAGGVFATVDVSWSVAGVGDMNHDGQADILWRNTDGTVALWEMNGTSVIGGGTLGNPGASWNVVGLADFNGDNRDDILWQNTDGTVALWEMDGTSFIGGGTIYNPGAAWKVAGTGDFNGDGKADIIFRNDSGAVAVWEMNGTAVLASASLGNPGTAWSIAAIADYNGDGKSDILWHNTDGTVAMWLMNGFTATASGSIGNPGTSWIIA